MASAQLGIVVLAHGDHFALIGEAHRVIGSHGNVHNAVILKRVKGQGFGVKLSESPRVNVVTYKRKKGQRSKV